MIFAIILRQFTDVLTLMFDLLSQSSTLYLNCLKFYLEILMHFKLYKLTIDLEISTFVYNCY